MVYSTFSTGWRRPIGCLKLQVIFRKGATNCRALLRNITYIKKASYGSSSPCASTSKLPSKFTYLHFHYLLPHKHLHVIENTYMSVKIPPFSLFLTPTHTLTQASTAHCSSFPCSFYIHPRSFLHRRTHTFTHGTLVCSLTLSTYTSSLSRTHTHTYTYSSHVPFPPFST